MDADQLEILSNQVALLKKDREKSTALLNQLDDLLHKIHDEVPGCYERAVQLVFDWYPNMKASKTEGPSKGANSVSFNGKPIAAPGSPFGNPATGLFGEGAKLPTNYGTTKHPFQPHVEHNLVADELLHFQTISCQECYRHFSVDELRLQDYANRAPQSPFFSTAPKHDNTPGTGPSALPTGASTTNGTSSRIYTAPATTSSSNVKTECSTDESDTTSTTDDSDTTSTTSGADGATTGTGLFGAPCAGVSSEKHAVGSDSSTDTPAVSTDNRTASGSRWHPYAGNQATRSGQGGSRGGRNRRRGRYRSSGNTGR